LWNGAIARCKPEVPHDEALAYSGIDGFVHCGCEPDERFSGSEPRERVTGTVCSRVQIEAALGFAHCRGDCLVDQFYCPGERIFFFTQVASCVKVGFNQGYRLGYIGLGEVQSSRQRHCLLRQRVWRPVKEQRYDVIGIEEGGRTGLNLTLDRLHLGKCGFFEGSHGGGCFSGKWATFPAQESGEFSPYDWYEGCGCVIVVSSQCLGHVGDKERFIERTGCAWCT